MCNSRLTPPPPLPSPPSSIHRSALSISISDEFQLTSFSIKTGGNFTVDEEFGTIQLLLESLHVNNSYTATLEITPLNQGNFVTSTTTQAIQYRYLVGSDNGDEFVDCTGAVSTDSQPRNVISQREWAARRLAASPAQASVALTCGLALILIPYRAVAVVDKMKKPVAWREAQLVSFFICGLFVSLIIVFTKDEIKLLSV